MREFYQRHYLKIFDLYVFLGYHNAMIVTEQINGKLQRLPVPLQKEVLDFVDFLLHKNSHDENEWNEFSLAQAMRGLEDDDMPEYTEADLIEKW